MLNPVGYQKEASLRLKESLLRRFPKCKVKSSQTNVVVNTGSTATLQGVRRGASKGLGKAYRFLLSEVVILKGYHAYEDEDSDSDHDFETFLKE